MLFSPFAAWLVCLFVNPFLKADVSSFFICSWFSSLS